MYSDAVRENRIAILDCAVQQSKDLKTAIRIFRKFVVQDLVSESDLSDCSETICDLLDAMQQNVLDVAN